MAMIRRYNETYDMNTTVGQMTMLAIHTPQANALKKMFKGHFLNFKKYTILGCDIRMACASQLPLSPDQVGLEAGEVDPRDVMNPMLFKACTGENLNALLNQIYNASQEESENAYGSVGEHLITNEASLNAYYQLLADPSFRKAHPQAGINVRGLKPFVHKVVTTQPFKWTGRARASQAYGIYDAPMMAGSGSPQEISAYTAGAGSPSGVQESDPNGQGNFDATNPSVFVSSGITKMPWLDTAVRLQVNTLGAIQAGQAEVTTSPANWLINNVPRIYMGCLIMPPAVSTKFYMRMVISWKIAFKDFRPAYEIGNIGSLNIIDSQNGMVSSGDGGQSNFPNSTYFNFYHDEANKSLMQKEESSFSSNGVDSTEMIVTS